LGWLLSGLLGERFLLGGPYAGAKGGEDRENSPKFHMD
jgi:hypothetical protein